MSFSAELFCAASSPHGAVVACGLAAKAKKGASTAARSWLEASALGFGLASNQNLMLVGSSLSSCTVITRGTALAGLDWSFATMRMLNGNKTKVLLRNLAMRKSVQHPLPRWTPLAWRSRGDRRVQRFATRRLGTLWCVPSASKFCGFPRCCVGPTCMPAMPTWQALGLQPLASVLEPNRLLCESVYVRRHSR